MKYARKYIKQGLDSFSQYYKTLAPKGRTFALSLAGTGTLCLVDKCKTLIAFDSSVIAQEDVYGDEKKTRKKL